MPKKNQIPFFDHQPLAGGRTGYYWRPSPRLRRAGFKVITLGTDYRAAVLAAIEQNDRIAVWECSGNSSSSKTLAASPRRRWRDLVGAYKLSSAFTDLKPKSQREYGSRLATLTRWAMDGELLIALLDRPMVIDLRNALVDDGRRHRTAALLRVLRVLLQFAADNGWIETNPAAGIDIPEAPSRKRILQPGDVEALAAAALTLGQPRFALAIRLGFWTFQRESDLLALGRLNWRELTDLPREAAAVLAGADGRVMGLRVQQAKTGAWVHVPVPLWLRADIEALGFDGPLLPYADWKAQRLFRQCAAAAGIDDATFRDLRRSGMVYYGELGVPLVFITAISGHAVLGAKRTILDTYMPGNARFAAQGVAMAVTRHLERERQARENEA